VDGAVARLRLTRRQILAYRRRVGGLEERVPLTTGSLRQAAWAGLQDSMPRAALLAIHARLEGVGPSAWEHASLAQLWGPRFSTYVVPKRDFALFSLGRYPDDAKSRQRAERVAGRMHAHLGAARMTDRELGRAVGLGTVWAVPAARIAPADACRELARRYLHVFGPTTAESFARWAGIGRRSAADAFASLEGSLLPVRSPLGDEWLLAEDEAAVRAAQTAGASVRLLPSGDAYSLLDGRERELLVPRADLRDRLWTSRVWPGALLVEGEIRGTWRRSQHTVRIDAWSRLSRRLRDAVEAEAASLPLPGIDRRIEVIWAA
jgi:hypothetical protein